jgi:1A family penicillin-binding protein
MGAPKARKQPNEGSSRRKRSRPVRRTLKRGLNLVATLLLAALLIFAVYFGVLLHRAGETVDNVSAVMAEFANRPTVFVSADGTRLAEFRTIYRDPAKLDEMPEHLQNATIAAEDKRFWKHSGIDPIGMARAAWVMLRGGPVQGGSTIAQQICKELYTNKERTLSRKLQDMALAIQLERRLTKRQILELYLNQVYYGAGAYGVKAAADVYFGKELRDLSLSECALLARLPRRPSASNPFVDREAALRNRDVVLDLMLEQGMISPSERDQAKVAEVKLAPRRPAAETDWMAPYAVTEVMRVLRSEMNTEHLYRGGYTVELTLDYRVQKIAEEAVAETLRDFRKQEVNDAAAFVMDLDGRILAIVGGKDFKVNQYNVITQGKRQPGSSFKPLVYAVAFELGLLTPTSLVNDSRSSYSTGVPGRSYTPRNADGDHWGWIPVRTALAKSRNCAAVYANSLVTPKVAAAEVKSRFGFRSPIEPVMSLPLGACAVSPIEMAEAFSVFAKDGDRIRPYLIRSVTAPDGTVIYRGRPKVFRHAVSRGTAEDIDSILRDVVRHGTGYRAAGIPDAHGKTGTTSDFRDAWFVGYAGKYLAVSWVGNPEYDEGAKMWVYRPMKRVYGGTVPVLTWRHIMKGIAELPDLGLGSERRPTPEPEGVVTVRVCADSGQVATPYCPRTEEREFVSGTEPTASCPLHVQRTPEVVVVPMDDIQDLHAAAHRDRPAERGSHEQSPATVKIWVCVESGLPANPYCPEVVEREFPRDQVPTGLCHLHGP